MSRPHRGSSGVGREDECTRTLSHGQIESLNRSLESSAIWGSTPELPEIPAARDEPQFP